MNTLTNRLFRVNLSFFSSITKSVVVSLSTDAPVRKRKPVNRAMRAYIERVKAYEDSMRKSTVEYQNGKRFLATMMGEDPATFTDKDVDKAIEYLLPSQLYHTFTRPLMKPPEEIFPKVKEAKFDETGRPYHYLFYTGAASVYEIQHETVKAMTEADQLLNKVHSTGRMPEKENKLDLVGHEWLTKGEFEALINGKIRDKLFEETMTALQRLIEHPMSSHVRDFIMQYRKPVKLATTELITIKPKQDADGRLYVEAEGSRKRANATVIVRSPGTGKILINGEHDISYFNDLQAREQVIYPLQFTGLLGKVDLEAEVSGGGFTGQSGAIRLATSKAIQSLVDEEMVTKMQVAGLLTYDRRTRERKKPGQWGARRKYTWLKR